jgi:hypothetical protein
MLDCKVCGLDLVASEKDKGICFSCENTPEKFRVYKKSIDKKTTELEENNPENPAIKIKTYNGDKNNTAAILFEKDTAAMAMQGYFPISQSYQQGTWGCGAFIIALLLCFILVGLIVFIYMMIVKPPGTLTVTYEYREKSINKNGTQKQLVENNNGTVDVRERAEDKVCPQCAESVKIAANICRYCRYDFNGSGVS